MKRLWILPALFVAIMVGGVGIANATGVWVASGREVVVAGQALGVDDLKGWMTLQQAADGVGVPVADLAAIASPANPGLVSGATAFKDLEKLVPGFELSTFKEQVRAFLAARGTGPAASASPTAAPAQTAPAASETPKGTGTPTGSGTPAASDTQTIRGSTTLRQVAATYGLDVARLAQECGLPADVDPDTTLKDLTATVPGFEVGTVRDAVERLR